MRLAFIPLALLVVPVVEIAAFIVIGDAIGLWPTLLMILVTAVLGTILLRRQGLALFAQMRREMDAGRVPARELADAAMLLAAGILLLTPGFVTDAIGFALFLPPVRAAIRTFVTSRVRVVGPGGMDMGAMMGRTTRSPRNDDGPVVDLDANDYATTEKPSDEGFGDGREPPHKS